ncbi:peptidylprolyl isomerase [Microbaculum marinisediminis]|uniref:Parvulin-like PPIase n=1 Tax=Microbaculum marinisediminis TaxID=2931392 RepID=A0AAW5QWU7_9HYPH|nr:peptidylprolyl isomerase [Microbaculum sp. A6E488]MCT8971472.1 peptidylprolyl isomerase [Microbaculum sp. A6E488]
MTISIPSSLTRMCVAATLAAGLAMTLPVPLSAQDNQENDVVARVNGKDITKDDLKMALEDIRESMPQMSKAQRRDYLVSYLTDLELVSEAARKAGLADEEEVKQRLDYLVKRALMEMYLSREAEKVATPEEAQKLYDQVIADIPAEDRVRARHILVETEDEAKEIKAEIDAGKDFAEIAAEKSKDPGSGAEGGDLGWFTKEQMVPEFAEAAFALGIGDVSEPVKSDFGWHIIKVEEKRDKPGFDEVEDQLYEMLVRQKQRDIIMGLRDEGTVERLDKPADDEQPSADDADEGEPAAAEEKTSE